MSNRRGDTISPVIMWIGVVLAVIIAATWFVMTLRPVEADIEAAQTDLGALRTAVDRACSSVNYSKSYNPRTEKGVLLLNATRACVQTSSVIECTALTCALPQREIDLESVTTITIRGQAGSVQITEGP